MAEAAMTDRKRRDLPDPLPNRNQVAEYICEHLGYEVAPRTVYNHIAKADGLRPSKGGWPKRTVAQYAEQFFGHKRRADFTPAGGLPLWKQEGEAEADKNSASLDRSRAETALKQAMAERQRLKLAAERGQTVPREVVERDLALRAQAFRYGLENFIHDALGEIAAMFGGEERTARDLVRLVCGDESKAGEIVRRVQQREPEMVAMWMDQVERFLEPYAAGSWWDDELARAMDAAPADGIDNGGQDAGSGSGE